MSIELTVECERCGRVRKRIVPVRFHYSDGCYTVMTIPDQACGRCDNKKADGKHSPDCQGTCCGGLP